MSEIKYDLIKLESGNKHVSEGEEYVITENHSINDVLRFCVEQLQGDKDEILYLLKNMD